MENIFGRFIKEKREQRQMSVRGFSVEIGISPEYLSKIENGLRSAPKDYIVERIAEKLVLKQEEKEMLFDLAAESKGINSLASDLIEYINDNELVHKILRIGKRCNVDTTDWQKIIDYLSEKYL